MAACNTMTRCFKFYEPSKCRGKEKGLSDSVLTTANSYGATNQGHFLTTIASRVCGPTLCRLLVATPAFCMFIIINTACDVSRPKTPSQFKSNLDGGELF